MFLLLKICYKSDGPSVNWLPLKFVLAMGVIVLAKGRQAELDSEFSYSITN